MKKANLFLSALLAAAGVCAQTTGPLVLNSPQDYYVTGLSVNGKWACGTYSNGNNMLYGFRWNLESNEIELLSGDDCESQADGISNDGTVVGCYENSEATQNGAPVLTAGYWKDGSWHHLPNIGNAWVSSMEGVGYAKSITADGKYIGGAYNDADGVCIPVIWEDGKVTHTFGGTGYDAMAYGISEDGTMLTGWSINKESEMARVATMWKTGTPDPILLMDSKDGNAWCVARAFSPNGKKILYWEKYYDVPADQITDPNASNMGIIAIYDVETGEKDSIPTVTAYPYNIEFFDINDDCTVVGYEQLESTQESRGIIYKDGQTMWMEDYLIANGVDLDAQDQIMLLSDSTSRYIFQAKGISNDGKTLTMLYYDKEGAFRTMVVKLDENLTTREPVQVKAARLPGLQAAKVTWAEPLAGADGVKGYNIYRNGVKVNTEPVAGRTYVDGGLAEGDYTYHVTAVYASAESAASTVASLTVAAPAAEMPRNLFVRQRRLNDAIVQWNAPMSNLVVKSYADRADEITGFGGSYSFETAIRYDKEETALYRDNHKLTHVSFYPMSEQAKWTVNIYQRTAADAALELLHTQTIDQTLTYGVENVVALTQPVELPADADIYVAVAVELAASSTNVYNVVGEVYGKVEAGYSDLIRMLTESDFYSLYEAGKEYGYTQTTSWGIGMILTPDGTTADVDVVNHYNVYTGDTKLGETTTLSYVASGLSVGSHALGVEAVYADGRTSAKAVINLDMADNSAAYYKQITPQVSVDSKGATVLTAEWETPMDNDETVITYASDDLQGGVLGASENDYNYMPAAEYTPAMVCGYDGYQVTAFRFYPLCSADFTFFLLENGVTVAEQYVEEYKVNEWNTVKLDKPVTIDETATYMLQLDCYDVEYGNAPLGIDKQLPFVGMSDIYSQDEGLNFASVTQSSIYGNWMLGMVITSPNPTEMAIDGYDVRIDGTKMNETLLTDTRFTHDFGADADGTHRINVDVHYRVGGKVSGNSVFFALGAAGIADNYVADLHIRKGENFITIEGEGVTTVSAVNMGGQTVAAAQGHVLDITTLSAGTYVLRIEANGTVRTAKVQVVK